MSLPTFEVSFILTLLNMFILDVGYLFVTLNTDFGFSRVSIPSDY